MFICIVVNRFFFSRFQLFGLGLLIPGILVVVNEDAINSEVLPALQSISVGATNMGDLAKGLSITLIVFGSFVLVLSFLGACGACCELKLFLVIVSRIPHLFIYLYLFILLLA